MTFIEAIQALKDGRCEGIKRPGHVDMYQFTNGRLIEKDGHIPCEAHNILADDWKLVGKKPQVVTVWGIINQHGRCVDSFDDPNEAAEKYKKNIALGDFTVVKLTGEMPKPKVKKKVSWESSWDKCKCSNDIVSKRPDVIAGKSGTITFEWEE